VVNDGETTEHLAGLYVEEAAPGPDGSTSGYDVWSALRGDHELRPRARFTATVRLEDLPWDSNRGFVGKVRLASGAEVASATEYPEPSLVQHIEEWNATARP
jgi:hypothetical protein